MSDSLSSQAIPTPAPSAAEPLVSADRLPPIPADHWTPAQRREAEAVIAGPRGALISPFVPLLRSPELMGHAQRMGEYLRYRSALGQRLSELAILLTARHWSQPVEWAIHAPIAVREGIPRPAVDAIARGQRPADLRPDEALVHDFCTELQREQRVGEPTWRAAVAAFGEQGVIDLIGVTGYYSFLSMVMNAAQTPAPPSTLPALAPLDRAASSLPNLSARP